MLNKEKNPKKIASELDEYNSKAKAICEGFDVAFIALHLVVERRCKILHWWLKMESAVG